MQKILLLVALVLGGLIAYADTRPTWDDTGVTAVLLLVAAGVFGFLGPKRPWLWAFALGVWIPLFGMIMDNNYGTIPGLAVAFAGAYGGMAIRRVLLPIGR